MKIIMKKIAKLVQKFSLTFLLFSFIASANAAEKFNDYLNTLYQKASNQGFSTNLLNEVFSQIQPIPEVLKLDQAQAGFHHGWWLFQAQHRGCAFCYINKSLSKKRIQQGRELYQDESNLLQTVAKRYDIQPEYLLALWGLETNYGEYQGNYPEFSALATLAYNPRRRSMFEREFFAALRMVNEKQISLDEMHGSWAGAMGQCQFMPSRYLTMAVNFKGAEHPDIWHNQGDALASMANYLHQLNWHNQGRMIQAVKLPYSFPLREANLQIRRPLSEWLQMGVVPRETLMTPSPDTLYSILAPDNNRQYAFLVDTHNFDVIMNWNHSKVYALSVGLLAREITLGQS